MDGVCAISHMAYKAMLEFPMKPGVCFWTVGEEYLEKTTGGRTRNLHKEE